MTIPRGLLVNMSGNDPNSRADAKSAPGTLRFPIPRLANITASFHNLQLHAEKERSKLKLSRMSFFRDAVRIRGSVLPKILPSVFGVTVWAACIFTADQYFDRKWKTSSAIVGPLSVVVGLLLVFRNSTSYDRWYEARKLWASATSDSRSLARYLWANVDVRAEAVVKQQGTGISSTDSAANTSSSKYGTARSTFGMQGTSNLNAKKADTGGDDLTEEQQRRVHVAIEKKQKAIRLLILFQYALAHELRNETGVDWADYDGVLPDDLRKLWDSVETATLSYEASRRQWRADNKQNTHDTLRSLAPEELTCETADTTDMDVEARTATTSAESSQDDPVTPRPEWFRKLSRPGTARETSPLLRKSSSSHASTPPPAMGLPLLAVHELGRYIASARKAGLLNDIGPAGFSLANAQLANLTTAHSSLKRIADCTIPVIYGIHLKQCE